MDKGESPDCIFRRPWQVARTKEIGQFDPDSLVVGWFEGWHLEHYGTFIEDNLKGKNNNGDVAIVTLETAPLGMLATGHKYAFALDISAFGQQGYLPING